MGPTWVLAAPATELVALWYALLAAPVSAFSLRRIPLMVWMTPLLVIRSEATINAEELPDETYVPVELVAKVKAWPEAEVCVPEESSGE